MSAIADLEQKMLSYEKDGKKYEYTGTVDAEGLQTGRGELRYPNGSMYEGDFANGKRHGFGKLIFSKSDVDPKYDGGYVFGQFVDGAPDETWKSWKIVYPNDDQYWGSITLEKNKRTTELLSIDDFLKHNGGEIYYAKYNIKYFGSFVQNCKEGFGICIFVNSGDRYYGGWEKDRYSDYGSYIHRDGTIYHGKWAKGIKNGKGTLNLPNGDVIEGTWKGEKLDNAVYKKGSCKTVSLARLKLLQACIDDALRKHPGYTQNDNENIVNMKWMQYFEMNKKEWEKQQAEMNKAIKMNGGISTEKQFEDCLQQFLNNKNGFIHGFINFFVSAFQGSYMVATAVKPQSKFNEIPFAIDDIKACLLSVNDLLRKFFDDNKTDARRFSHLQDQILLDLIHARVHQTLFPMYQAAYEEQDVLMNQKIRSLRLCSLEAIGVPKKFCPPPSSNEVPFLASKKKFEEIRSKKTPSEKIKVLGEVRNSVLSEIRKYRAQNRKHEAEAQAKEYTQADMEEDEQWQPGFEDAIGVYTYVWLSASIDNHTAQFQYLNDWKPQGIELDPVIHTITFYEGFPSMVLDLDPNLKTENGLLLSCYTICKNIENAIHDLIQEYEGTGKTLVFWWLPSLLIEVGMEVGGQKVTECVRLISLEGNEKLSQTIIKNYTLVEYIFQRAKIDLGFHVTIEQNGDNLIVLVEFARIYPTHIYTDISLHIAKFLHFSRL